MMTARFLIHLRDWEHHGGHASTPSNDGGDGRPMEFKKSERNTTRWTLDTNDFGVDPVLQAERDISLNPR